MDPTDTAIYTASVSHNAPVFLDILRLYVPLGASGCDVTYGRGVFWSAAAREHVGALLATDLKTDGVCLSGLPYADESQDFHVLDPPYMAGFFRRVKSQEALATHSDFSQRYGNPTGAGYRGLYDHAAVERLYSDGLLEAARVLKRGGVQITKVQDEVVNHQQELTHCHVVATAAALGLIAVDLFVVVRPDKPHCRRMHRQEHARKNHSFFLVFRKQLKPRA